MTLHLTVGATELPLPRDDQPYDSEYLGFGTQFRTLNGSLRSQHYAHKWRLRIYWHGLSASERTTLLDTFASLLSAAGTLTLPDGFACSVLAILGSWSERVWYSPWTDAPYYDASFQVEQV